MSRKGLTILISLLFFTGFVYSRIQLVTVPNRNQVKLAVYNSRDLTLVKDQRVLTFRKGTNKIEFSWANTKIDPSSLQLVFKKSAELAEVLDISYPPNINNTLVWNIEAEKTTSIPVEISYFTSGIKWEADHQIILSEDQKEMEFNSFVTISNHSGEDYENSSVRMVVGKVNLVEEIADLSDRQIQNFIRDDLYVEESTYMNDAESDSFMFSLGGAMPASSSLKKEKKIVKEGLSDYYLYQVPGEENINDKTKIRMRSSKYSKVPVENFYRYEPSRFGERVQKYLRFFNREDSKMGKEPVPEGSTYVFIRNNSGKLDFVGNANLQYLPVGETAELSLGADSEIVVTRKIMSYKTEEYEFDNKGNIDGYEEYREWELKIQNFLSRPVIMEIQIPIDGIWEFNCSEQYEKKDYRTIQMDRVINPEKTIVIPYRIRHFHGKRAENK